jgi:predicted Zn-dependent protease
MRKKCSLNVGPVALLAFVLGLVGGCSVVQKGTDVLVAGGKMKESDQKTLLKTGEAIRSTFADITEEEEYYIGRAVAAMILARYQVYNDDKLTDYVNAVGSAVAGYSDRPETYSGYHFLVLDSDEINAMSAPSGFIFVTKGLIKKCRNEEMLSAVLAHEVGHVAAKHGLQSIKKSRLVDAFKLLGTEAAKRYGPKELSQLTDIFEGVLGDIAGTLIERGYDRKYEYEADELSIKFASRTGYNPAGLTEFLTSLGTEAAGPGAKGWFKTHPSALDRLAKAKAEIASLGKAAKTEPVRTQRFQASVSGLK